MLDTIDDYLDAARARLGSDNAVARALGIKSASTSAWRTKRSWPSDHHMVQLATIIDVEDVTALAQLNVWRTPSPAMQAVYRRMLTIVRATTGAIVGAAVLASTIAEQLHAIGLNNCIL